MIIYPPLIDNIIPGFIVNDAGSAIIKIPYTHNDLVDFNQVTRIKIRVKDYISSYTIPIASGTITSDFNNNTATFTLQKTGYEVKGVKYNFPELGQYYKIQIAYIDNTNNTNDTNLTYSTVGLARCVSQPLLEIRDGEDIKSTVIEKQKNAVVYTGHYEGSINNTNLLYSYQFDLYNQFEELMDTTGEKIWNIENNKIQGEKIYSLPTYTNPYELEYGKSYKLKFTITTVEGYSDHIDYNFEKAEALPMLMPLSLTASPNHDEGYIELKFANIPTNLNGKFIIERSTQELENIQWQQLFSFSVGANNRLSEWSWKDYNIAHGTSYVYRIRQFNKGWYSIPNKTPYIIVNYSDMFLSDENKQLKICFNPKVSSLKQTTLETKQDTIGGQYPLFYRNGQVKYKEIPISGLISYLMDEAELFMSKEQLGLDGASTSLTNINIAAEQKFRMAVLDWLNNGQPKFFRSPTEGLCVLRLMNISLSPNDTVGRMIWTFSATGYEIANYTYQDLGLKKLIHNPDIENYTTLGIQNEVGNLNGKQLNNVKNIKWTTQPNSQATLRLIEDNTSKEINILNITGIVETPVGTCYSLAEFTSPNNISSTVNYESYKNKYNSTTDQFGQQLYQSVEWIQNTSFTPGEQKTNVLYLHIEKQSQNSNAHVKLLINNDNEIDLNLEDGQIRIYQNLASVVITESENVRITMCIGEEQ